MVIIKTIIIEGNKDLSGTINISGAKNSAVALIPAAILSDEEVIIDNLPNISDTQNLIEILKLLNCNSQIKGSTIKINTKHIKNAIIPENYSKKLRASYYFMGALLGKFKQVEMYFPGGCNIGSRPINLHLKGFEQMGVKIDINEDKYTLIAQELRGTNIYLDIPSVGATINLMLAATKAKGTTIIENAAKEPEIVNIASLLNNMGAKIKGAGTSTIKIEGVKNLTKARIEVIPDRIEAGTYIIIGALCGKNLKINNIICEHIEPLLSKLTEAGVNIKYENNSIIINKNNNYKAVNIKTLVYPGFPTDLGQPMATFLTQCEGISNFEETLYENRMGHVSYLNKMGANIKTKGQTLEIKGKTPLEGRIVTATDLRAGAAMVIAGLAAAGKTTIMDADHVLRGYENIAIKLNNVGAKIEINEIK